MSTGIHPWVQDCMRFLREAAAGLWIMKGDTAEPISPHLHYGVFIEPTGDNDNEPKG